MKTMKRLMICVLLAAVVAWTLAAEPKGKGAFAISADAKAKFTKDVKSAYTVHECDATAGLRAEKAAEKWVRDKFDLNRAEVRDSRKFPGRRVYQKQADKADKGAVELFVTDKRYTGYVKELNLDAARLLATYPKTSRPKNATAKKALAFVKEIGLVTETANDRIGQTIVRERKRNLGGVEGEPDGVEVVVSEYVRFVRHVDGIPVLNSYCTVEFDSLTGEIISMEQQDWTPVAPASVKKTVTTNKKSNEMVEWVRQRAHRRLGDRMNVKLKDMKQVWYQAEDRLVPVIVCNIGATDSEGDGTETEKFTDIINLTDDPGVPDKWSETRSSWPKEPPPEYPTLDSYDTYR